MAADPGPADPSVTSASSPRRLALILRGMPPVFRDGADGATLRGYYYGRLWDGWTVGQRAVATTLAGPPAPGPSDGLGRRAWRLGFRRRNLQEIEARRAPDAALEHFLDQDERKGLHAIINHAALPLNGNPLKNKALFEARCHAAGLPIPATVAEAGQAARFSALISKPGMGSKGKGVVRLVRQADGDWRSSDGSVHVAKDALDDWIGGQRRQGRLIQQCMIADPSLARISPGALPTLRVVTFRDEQDGIEITDMALRLSLAADRAADNFNMDNLVAAVDAANGRVGPALRRTATGFLEYATHPATGAPIEGARLEQCEAARALALAAHRHFADHAVIGWDIGLTQDGPALIEGNWNPGYNVLQLVHGKGLGQLRMGALYRHHLERAPQDAWSRAAPVQIAQLPFRTRA